MFSGYDDISNVPQDVEGYVWWYQAPIKFEQNVLAEEIRGYAQKLGFVLSKIDETKPFVILTMGILYAVPFTDDDYLLQASVVDYNRALYEVEANHKNVKVIDITEFTRKYNATELLDWKFYFMSQMGMNPKLSKEFKIWWEKKLNSISLKRKKCLVLDLDNTLWGGVLGEEGIEGIKIGGDYPGKAFLYWQEALLVLSKSGVILTVCSKNNESDVLEVWEKNPFIVLKKEHFAAYRINWTDKATNIKELAAELNIGLDSFVFVDDNPTERELVNQMLPMVEVAFLDTHPEYALVSCGMINFDENGDWGVQLKPEKPTVRDFAYTSPFCHAPVLMRRDALNDVSNYTVRKTLRRGQDYFLWHKFYKKGYKGYNLQTPYYKMRDDQNAAKRRTFKDSWYGCKIQLEVMSNLGLLWYLKYRAFRSVIVGLIPRPIYLMLHKHNIKSSKTN